MNHTFLNPIACAFGLVCSASAATLHTESVDGELSNVIASPTPLVVTAADTFTIMGQVGANRQTGATNGFDADFFTVMVPADFSVTSIRLVRGPSDATSFLGWNLAGPVTSINSLGISGFVLFNSETEILDDINGGTEINPNPLGQGNYGFWIQETANQTPDYTLTLTVVPEPAVVGCLGLGAVSFLRRRR